MVRFSILHLAVWSSVLLGTALAAEEREVELFVDPVAGSDSGNGSRSRPFRSLVRALSGLGSGARSTVHLAPGLYGDRTESFPILLPGAVARLRLLGSDNGSARFENPAPGGALLMTGPGTGAPEVAFEFRNLSLRGGDRAISVVGERGQRVSVSIERCEFAHQKYQAAELVAGTLGSLDARVDGCRLQGSFVYALDLGTRPDSVLSLEVRENRLSGVGGNDGAFPIRNGVALFLDAGARVQGRIDRNHFTDIGDALLVSTTRGTGGGTGVLEVDVTGNLIAGSPPSPDGSLRSGLIHGARLALHDAHSIRLRFLHNTLVNGRGYALFMEYPGEESMEGFCRDVEVDVGWNVLWGFGRGEINPFTTSTEVPAPRPVPGCLRFVRNAVGEGTLLDGQGRPGVRDNVRITAADFVDPGQGDYRPSAGSVLVDPGDVRPFRDWEPGDRDLAGGCRVSDGNDDGVPRIDIGALERVAGVCATDLRPFIRGNCLRDDLVNIADAVEVFTYLFLGGVHPDCTDACDASDDGSVDITDGIYVLVYLFLGGPQPPPPFPSPGDDPTADRLLCRR